jgi:hypothetical protein
VGDRGLRHLWDNQGDIVYELPRGIRIHGDVGGLVTRSQYDMRNPIPMRSIGDVMITVELGSAGHGLFNRSVVATIVDDLYI